MGLWLCHCSSAAWEHVVVAWELAFAVAVVVLELGVCCCAGADVRGLVVCSRWRSSAWCLQGLVFGLVVLYDMIVNFGVYVRLQLPIGHGVSGGAHR